MSDKIEVCAQEDLTPGERTLVQIGAGRTIGVFNVEDEYYAILNKCLHQGGPLCEGDICPGLDADPGDSGERVQEYYTDERIIICPWHGWAYDLESGENVANSDISIPVFEVVLSDGKVFVEI